MPLRKYLVIMLLLLLIPILPLRNSGFRSNSAVILTIREFTNVANNLASIYRTELNLVPRIVYIDDYGEITKERVKEIVENYFNSMRVIRFTILGDGELIPSDYGGVWDFYYSDLDNDGRPEVIIGRIPISTQEEGEIYLIKMMRYLNERSSKKILLIGGRYLNDLYPDGGQFIENAYWRNIPTYDVTRIYYLAGVVEPSPNVLVNYMNSDMYWLVVYSGHGDPTNWYINSGYTPVTEPSFNSSYVQTLRNRYPFIVFSDGCDTAKFYKESRGRRLDVNSIAEAFLFTEGGAIVYIGYPEHLQISEEHMNVFFRLISNPTITATGLLSTSLTFSSNYKKWVLLGDPNLPIKRPMKKISNNYLVPTHGIVLDALTKRPIPAARIEITAYPSKPWNSFFDRYSQIVVTNSKGIFHASIPPTLLKVTVEARGYHTWVDTWYYAKNSGIPRSRVFFLFPKNTTNYSIIFTDLDFLRTQGRYIQEIKRILEERGIRSIVWRIQYESLPTNPSAFGDPRIVFWLGTNEMHPRSAAESLLTYNFFRRAIPLWSTTIIQDPVLAKCLSYPFQPLSVMELYCPTIDVTLRPNSVLRSNRGSYLPVIHIVKSENISIPVRSGAHVQVVYETSGNLPVIFKTTWGERASWFIGVSPQTMRINDYILFLRNIIEETLSGSRPCIQSPAFYP